ncbi:hypothetical protein [Paraburkholderia tagetis]|uniref:Uncharacterized protein n=1 Tax=Paraburkholderia tagetis TaxID=2913261 RepID=A0A9X1RXA0_9BURK|nr:hypothetical protein [Paraburkholderia tagetis]MCG5076894.1 hypothetical protein [Paraburkholderia tagetis]
MALLTQVDVLAHRTVASAKFSAKLKCTQCNPVAQQPERVIARAAVYGVPGRRQVAALFASLVCHVVPAVTVRPAIGRRMDSGCRLRQYSSPLAATGSPTNAQWCAWEPANSILTKTASACHASGASSAQTGVDLLSQRGREDDTPSVIDAFDELIFARHPHTKEECFRPATSV